MNIEQAKAAVVAARNLKDEAVTKSCDYILSAIGYPGYGEGYATKVIMQMATYGVTAGDVIYGGSAYRRAVYEEQWG